MAGDAARDVQGKSLVPGGNLGQQVRQSVPQGRKGTVGLVNGRPVILKLFEYCCDISGRLMRGWVRGLVVAVVSVFNSKPSFKGFHPAF